MDDQDERLRQEFAGLISEYYSRSRKSEIFIPGETGIPSSGKMIGIDEIKNGVLAVLEGWLTEGHWTDAFEMAMAGYLGVRYGSFCNSGSSANMLALSALTSPLMKEARLLPGDEVITTAAGFPTTINPIIWNRFVPVFIDVKIGTYVPTIEQIEEAIGPKTKAVMLAHTLGNPWPIHKMKDHSLWLIEDNCDALGSVLAGKSTGTWGHVSTQSFYPAHHITTGEGGMVLTDNPRIHKAIESFRDWGRDCWCDPGKENTCGKRFDHDWEHLPHGYDHKYVYSHLGFNFKSTDIQAAIGLAQLERLHAFTRARYDNAKHLWYRMKEVGLQRFFIFPAPSDETAAPSWFGFPLTIRTIEGTDNPMFNREELMRFLSDKKIGTRLLFTSNYMKQPVFHDVLNSGMLEGFRVVGDLPATNRIVRDTFWIGCWPGITEEMIEYVISQFLEFTKKEVA